MKAVKPKKIIFDHQTIGSEKMINRDRGSWRSRITNAVELNNFPPLFAAIAVATSLFAYIPALRGSFFSDDLIYIVNNNALRAIPLQKFWNFFLTRTNPYEYLPVRDLSYRIDLALFDLDPWGYHLHNLLLYGLTCLVVWYCSLAILRLFRGEQDETGSGKWGAAVVTALFALHPAHVESVAWISGRKDLLSGLFAFWALWQFLSARRSHGWSKWRLTAAYLLFTLALLSKATVTPLPLVLLLIVLVHSAGKSLKDKKVIKSYLSIIPFIALSCASVLTQMMVGAETQIKSDPFQTASFRSEGLFEFPFKILGYLTHIGLVPLRLRLIYDLQEPGLKNTLTLILGISVLVAFLVAMLKLLRSKSLGAFGIAVFVIFSLPFLQLIPFSTWSLVSERFLFMPIFGLAIFGAAVLKDLHYGRTVFLPSILILYLCLTAGRSMEWSTPEKTLLLSNLQYSSESPSLQLAVLVSIFLPEERFNEAYASASMVRGDLWREALRCYIDASKALHEGTPGDLTDARSRLEMFFGKDSNGHILNLIGRIYEKENNFFQASRYYYHAAKKQSDTSRKDLERIQERFSSNLNQLKAIIENNPSDMGNRLQLAGFHMELFQLDKAEREYKRIINDTNNLEITAMAYYNLGLVSLAWKVMERRLKI